MTVLADAPALEEEVTAATEAVPESGEEAEHQALVSELERMAAEHRDFLVTVRAYAISIRRDGRASYCKSGLDTFLKKHHMPQSTNDEAGETYSRASVLPDPPEITVSMMPVASLPVEDYSPAGLRKIVEKRRAFYETERAKIRDYAIYTSDHSGYYSWDVRDEFLALTGFEPRGRTRRVSMSLSINLGVPVGDGNTPARELYDGVRRQVIEGLRNSGIFPYVDNEYAANHISVEAY